MKKKTNFWCRIFGHSVGGHSKNKNSYTRYFSAKGGAIDGIKRHHIQLYCECDFCGELFHVGNIHGTEDGRILKTN